MYEFLRRYTLLTLTFLVGGGGGWGGVVYWVGLNSSWDQVWTETDRVSVVRSTTGLDMVTVQGSRSIYRPRVNYKQYTYLHTYGWSVLTTLYSLFHPFYWSYVRTYVYCVIREGGGDKECPKY